MSEKSQYECSNCGYVSSVKLGRCPQCGQFGTFIVRKPIAEQERKVNFSYTKKPQRTTPTFLPELNFVLGGGLKSGSVLLLGGEPGIGKSTLALQILGNADTNALYVSSEETREQVLERAERIGLRNINVVSESDLGAVDLDNYGLICVDSLQTIRFGDMGAPGSPAMVKEIAGYLVKWAKESNGIALIVAHVTKEGVIAGPRTVEHMVDVVLYLEGDRTSDKRLLKLVKNRFGPSTDQILLEMQSSGLTPSEVEVSGLDRNQTGLVLSAVNTGTRFEFVQVHALVTDSYGQIPKRLSSRYPNNRLLLLTAVMQKYLRVPLYKYDIYVDLTTDFFVNDYGVDAAIVAAVYSSLKEMPISGNTLVYGEVLLTGDIRSPHPETQLDRLVRGAQLKRTNASTVVELIKELF
ncbi:DNA repair protein RadA [Coprothermobacter proteolyticus]|uniref:ATPase domain-containing protein n=1 Tax=Coprothermobacter proteolyticus TaxID=35786 RepID=UPI000D2FB6EC|nr:ATPase domain-containing protein [Coprothermobacter proteolyticus]MBP8983487.1 DNA repair protein RadA [Coprothermobacter sp.]NLT84247.1 DNA repair protein RadA [Coprothermobacter proteolyticus]HOK24006.1 ATPase domain-containing protein [Coprothermobacter proteolyticus]HOL53188.1 ATPase domain-containing protein [Coprothermobacter proteolyticus]HPO83280.1 ATPase domain-containing protein [Coprothermobacter proteolyticus]